MSDTIRPLTVARDKLARALNGQPEVVRAIEQLIQRVGQEMPGDLETVVLSAETAQEAADSALVLAAAAQAMARAAAAEARAAALAVEIEELRGIVRRLRRDIGALQQGVTP